MTSSTTSFAPFAGRLAAAFLALLVIAVPLRAQEPPVVPPQQELPDSVQALVAEYQQKQERLQTLQMRALEGNPELQLRQGEVRGRIEAAIHEVDPEAVDNIERLQALEMQAMAAQQAQDMARLEAVIEEAQGIQARLQAAQVQALERPDVQEEIETFQEEMMAEMVKLDPEAPALLAEIEALQERLGIG